MRLIGVFYVLTAIPLWATALALFFFTISVIWFLRDQYEGLAYNIALSSQHGDLALIGVVLIGASILQAGGAVPWFVNNATVQLSVAALAIVVGIVWWWIERPAHWGDVYHHLVVAPLFVYLLLLSVPVIFWSGGKGEIAVAIVLAVVWGMLVDYDAKTGRLDQRKYLEQLGITLSKK